MGDHVVRSFGGAHCGLWQAELIIGPELRFEVLKWEFGSVWIRWRSEAERLRDFHGNWTDKANPGQQIAVIKGSEVTWPSGKVNPIRLDGHKITATLKTLKCHGTLVGEEL